MVVCSLRDSSKVAPGGSGADGVHAGRIKPSIVAASRPERSWPLALVGAGVVLSAPSGVLSLLPLQLARTAENAAHRSPDHH
jgi:hypothetical protein